MALPTTPRYWMNRKEAYEHSIARHRNQESDFRHQWEEHADYFKKNNVVAAKQQAWESTPAYKDRCTDAFKKSSEREMKALNLKQRQEKLRAMLLEENRQWEAELKQVSRQNCDKIENMKDRAEELRSAREEKRKKIAEDKLYDHWQQNNPDIRKVRSELLKDYVVGQWPTQIEEMKQKEEEARREKEAIERQMEEERLAALEKERQEEAKRLKEERQLREHLKRQIQELRQREAEAEQLKRQQDALLLQQWEVEQLEAERKEKEQQRKRSDLGRILLRQHKAQMMSKSRRIQEELEEDRLLLEMLIKKEEKEDVLQTARREKARADAQWMKQVIEDQIRLEKAREAELDVLFQDEAARMWQKRDAEWERERLARERLMKEVLESRQEQIAVKLEEIKQQHQESIERREELLQEIEIANQLTQREQKEAEATQKAFKHSLEEQITERREQEKLARLKLQEEEEEEEKADMEYQDFVQQETERLRQRGYKPELQGRKQAWT
ncbi:trichoplein keratin filament-binding protein-like [Pomacea canaliculata]|uniref:trichoplein keratin filament-binding protein-like n=1 Tax=Pomacea canaliculata TaxID=400727 RepID=UPI000D738DA8|nr:trichoplein keratin filament-binding protein-like [Pomacea canaliculata]